MKPPKKKTPAAKADEIGARFEAAQSSIDQSNAVVRGCKEEAQALADSAGAASASAKGKYILGDTFVVGYYDRAGSTKFDHEGFAKAHPELHAKCMVMKTVFDEDMFISLVKANKISEKLVKKFATHGPSVRIAYVKRKTEKQ